MNITDNISEHYCTAANFVTAHVVLQCELHNACLKYYHIVNDSCLQSLDWSGLEAGMDSGLVEIFSIIARDS